MPEHRDELLFTETEVAGYKLKALSFGDLTRVTPELVNIFDKAAALITSKALTPTEVVKIIFVLLPDLTPIIAKVCNVPEEEIAALPATDGVKLASAIWQLNKEIITDFFGIAGSLVVAR